MIQDIAKILLQTVSDGNDSNTSKYVIILLVTIYVLSKGNFNISNALQGNIGQTMQPIISKPPGCTILPLTFTLMFIGIFIYTIYTILHRMVSCDLKIDSFIVKDMGCPLNMKCPFNIKCPLSKYKNMTYTPTKPAKSYMSTPAPVPVPVSRSPINTTPPPTPAPSVTSAPSVTTAPGPNNDLLDIVNLLNKEFKEKITEKHDIDDDDFLKVEKECNVEEDLKKDE